MQKDEIRQEMLERRLSLSDKEREQVSLKIQENLMKSSYWPKSGRVGLYSPVKGEVMTQDLFQRGLESGLRVYFPRVEVGIQFYEVNGPEDLNKGSWSIPEPKIDCLALPENEELDLLVVPGIVFTLDGYRIGYGRGFYDKFISAMNHKIPTLALGYDFQIVDQMPLDSWDEPLTGIVTEKGVRLSANFQKK